MPLGRATAPSPSVRRRLGSHAHGIPLVRDTSRRGLPPACGPCAAPSGCRRSACRSRPRPACALVALASLAFTMQAQDACIYPCATPTLLADRSRWNPGAAARNVREDWLGAHGAGGRGWRGGCADEAARDDSIAPMPPRRRPPGVADEKRRSDGAGTSGRSAPSRPSPVKVRPISGNKGEAEAKAHGRRSGRG